MGNDLPGRLADLAEPPQRLYLRGELPRGPAVAIVGTREPTAESAHFAEELALALASADIAVISGGAEGIDTCAHRGALAAGGCTVVVAAAGFERPYPEKNAELFRRVVSNGGAYLSLVPSEEPATSGAFFVRNSCLVALAHAVVVVEAPLRSGARNAAKHARQLGRPLFVVPHPPWNARGRGCAAELRLGARLLMSKKDLLKELDEQRQHSLPFVLPRSPWLPAPEEQAVEFPETSPTSAGSAEVVAAVAAGAVTADEICLATTLRAGRVSELILTLRLEGVLVTDSAGRLQIGK